MAVRNAVVIVPQISIFESVPHLDVALSVPECDPARTGLVCFDDFENAANQTDLFTTFDRRVIYGGHGSAGDRLIFDTEGWPTRAEPVNWGAGVGSILAILFGAGLWWRSKRIPSAAAPSAARKRRLESRRGRLILAIREVRAAYERGDLPKSELDLQELVIRKQLESVYEGLGVDRDAPAGAAQSADGTAHAAPTG